jgi:hypothetical protein
LVVEIGGTTARPGGFTFDITWSLAADRGAAESDDAIREGAAGFSTSSARRSARRRGPRAAPPRPC